jgi:hypothetical protein
MIKNKTNCFGNYRDFLIEFIKQGYKFVGFNEFNSLKNQIILRHDIDFDVELALRVARIENELGIKSTYFFLLRSDFYNPFAKSVFENIIEIKNLGHKISIHFDPTLYDDFQVGFLDELDFFESTFKVKIEIVSLHRPNLFFQKYNQEIGGIEHTYQDKYFKVVKYFADSTGKWRFGNPIQSNEFKNKDSIHLVIHPIWWMIEGDTNLDVLRNYFNISLAKKRINFEDNSIPFREISNEF